MPLETSLVNLLLFRGRHKQESVTWVLNSIHFRVTVLVSVCDRLRARHHKDDERAAAPTPEVQAVIKMFDQQSHEVTSRRQRSALLISICASHVSPIDSVLVSARAHRHVRLLFKN